MTAETVHISGPSPGLDRRALLFGRISDTLTLWEAANVLRLPHQGSLVVVAAELPELAREVVAGRQVFAEAAVDLGRALAAYRDTRTGVRKGPRAGFPRRKRKGRCRDSFRLRNKRGRGGALAIRLPQENWGGTLMRPSLIQPVWSFSTLYP